MRVDTRFQIKHRENASDLLNGVGVLSTIKREFMFLCRIVRSVKTKAQQMKGKAKEQKNETDADAMASCINARLYWNWH